MLFIENKKKVINEELITHIDIKDNKAFYHMVGGSVVEQTTESNEDTIRDVLWVMGKVEKGNKKTNKICSCGNIQTSYEHHTTIAPIHFNKSELPPLYSPNTGRAEKGIEWSDKPYIDAIKYMNNYNK